jgi:hypothetical protein
MGLRYEDEVVEDALSYLFYKDTSEMWTQREQPTVKDVIKWLIIKGYISDDLRLYLIDNDKKRERGE